MKSRFRIALGAVCLVLVSMVANAADFTVTTTNDAGAGSLRQAIADANTTPGRDRVVFAIPGTGLRVIRPSTSLPVITDPLEIDAYTQPGSSPNTMLERDNAGRRIELNGVVSGGNGFTIRTSDSVIRGFAIRKFGNAISLEGSSNLVVGNHLGTDTAPMLFSSYTNADAGNGRGIFIGSGVEICCNTIGGGERAARNVIAGNSGNSISIGNGTPLVSSTRILGNFLGVDSSGIRPSVYQNNTTLSLYNVADTIIGGLEEGAGNVFASGPGLGSITFHQSYTTAIIRGNRIGIGADGITRLPNVNWGITISAFGTVDNPILHVDTIIEGNVIAYCDQAAVGVREFDNLSTGIRTSSDRITISKNRMFANATNAPSSSTSLSIFLGSALNTNDSLDLDVGANNRQNYPEFVSATFVGDSFIVSGFLDSAPLSDYRLEFFGNSVPHSSGYGEGEVFLGELEVNTDTSGHADFQMVFPASIQFHSYLSATATSMDGSTSMFARTFQARSFVEPVVHANPSSATRFTGTNVTFRAEVSGAEPLALQWRHDGIDIPGATNSTLTISNILWEDRGTYVLMADNGFGVAETEPATLTVIAVPTITFQPTNAFVAVGTNFTFVVQAGGVQPIAYQWRRDGVALPGATNSSLTFSNIDWPLRGDYSVVLSNAFGVVESDTATLFVKVRPVILQPPVSQTVSSGGVVYLSIAISNSATAPLTYIWRSNNIAVAAVTSMDYVGVFRVGPVTANAGYNVQVTNYFNVSGVLSTRANLTVLPDADADGLPDTFEDAYALNRNDPADAALDSDGDGVSNLDEYRAGTDPGDGLNQLRISKLEALEPGNRIEFQARSNHAYAVQFRDALNSCAWQTLAKIPARETNRLERWVDATPATPRYYRLQTPPDAPEP